MLFCRGRSGSDRCDTGCAVYGVRVLVVNFVILVVFYFGGYNYVYLRGSLGYNFYGFFFQVVRGVRGCFVVLLFLFFLVDLFLLRGFQDVRISTGAIAWKDTGVFVFLWSFYVWIRSQLELYVFLSFRLCILSSFWRGPPLCVNNFLLSFVFAFIRPCHCLPIRDCRGFSTSRRPCLRSSIMRSWIPILLPKATLRGIY